jgi:NADH:ubiquinone oxidoreductase subunit 6 (subunit J)
MSVLIFYLFVALALVSALIVVTSRNVVHSAFALMVTLFSVAAFYVFLEADFLAAIQLLVYIGGILVLVLFGVMMTSGKLDMKLRADAGLIVPATVVGVILFGLLLYTVRIESPFRQRLLLEDPNGSVAAQIQDQADDYPALAALSTKPVLRRLEVAYTLAVEPESDLTRPLFVHVSKVIANTNLPRIYVLSVDRDPDSPRVYRALVEKRVTTLLNENVDLADTEIATLTAAFMERVPAEIALAEPVKVVSSPTLLVRGGGDATNDLLTDRLGFRKVEDPRTVVGLGDAVMMGEFLLPFEVVGLVLLVALICAAVISRKGVAV